MADLKSRISDATKAAMKARDKARLGTLRLVNADIKRVEVDERVELDDDGVLAVLNRMLKQRRDSLSQYEKAGRDDLAAQERFEIEVIAEFMPEPLSEAELDEIIAAAVTETGAAGMKDMGRVMALVKEQVAGRADMGQVSGKVKAQLA